MLEDGLARVFQQIADPLLTRWLELEDPLGYSANSDDHQHAAKAERERVADSGRFGIGEVRSAGVLNRGGEADDSEHRRYS